VSRAASTTAPTPPTPAHGPSLTEQATSGFVWALTQGVGLKILGVAGQIVLARILVPEHFGVVAVAQGAAGIAQVLQWTGAQEVLIKRQKRFDLWATPAFWLTATMGLGAALALALSAPLVALGLKQPGVTGLIWVLCIANLFGTLGVVAQARLQAAMRFKAIAGPAVASQVGVLALAIAMAALGAGPWALVVPQAVMAPLLCLAYWRASGLRVSWQPRVQRWRFLLGDSLTLLGIALTGAIAGAAGSWALARLHDADEVGVYSVGFNLSMQTLMVVTGPLAAVLFPSLARLQDEPARMLGAFVRASRMLAMVGVPLCFLQAAAARPAMELLFGHKWDRAIPVVQLLSVGLAFAVLSGVASSVFKAQGRFRALLWWTIGACSLQIALVVGGAWLGDATYVAAGGLIYYALCGPGGAYAGVRPLGGGLRHMWQIFGPPVLLAGAAAAAAWWVGEQMGGSGPGGLIARCAVIGATMLVVYVPLARVLQPGPYAELVDRVLQYVPERRRPLVRALALLR
jgi:PST family polysaccharide transporter